jgi:hypothetical protein
MVDTFDLLFFLSTKMSRKKIMNTFIDTNRFLYNSACVHYNVMFWTGEKKKLEHNVYIKCVLKRDLIPARDPSISFGIPKTIIVFRRYYFHCPWWKVCGRFHDFQNFNFLFNFFPSEMFFFVIGCVRRNAEAAAVKANVFFFTAAPAWTIIITIIIWWPRGKNVLATYAAYTRV